MWRDAKHANTPSMRATNVVATAQPRRGARRAEVRRTKDQSIAAAIGSHVGVVAHHSSAVLVTLYVFSVLSPSVCPPSFTPAPLRRRCSAPPPIAVLLSAALLSCLPSALSSSSSPLRLRAALDPTRQPRPHRAPLPSLNMLSGEYAADLAVDRCRLPLEADRGGMHGGAIHSQRTTSEGAGRSMEPAMQTTTTIATRHSMIRSRNERCSMGAPKEQQQHQAATTSIVSRQRDRLFITNMR